MCTEISLSDSNVLFICFPVSYLLLDDKYYRSKLLKFEEVS